MLLRCGCLGISKLNFLESLHSVDIRAALFQFFSGKAPLANSVGMRPMDIFHHQFLKLKGKLGLFTFDDKEGINLLQYVNGLSRESSPLPYRLAESSLLCNAAFGWLANASAACSFQMFNHASVGIRSSNAHKYLRVSGSRAAMLQRPLIDSDGPFTIEETGKVDRIGLGNVFQLLMAHVPSLYWRLS